MQEIIEIEGEFESIVLKSIAQSISADHHQRCLKDEAQHIISY